MTLLRKTFMIEEAHYKKLLKLQGKEILATSTTVSVSSILNKKLAEVLK